MMIIRAREVAEANKAFRIASLDNVRLAILMESLLARESNVVESFTMLGMWLIGVEAPFLKDSTFICTRRHQAELRGSSC
jgi:hypothetical protein